jgi:lipoprotein NlpI
LSVVAGDVHPEIANIYLNLGMMYQETEQNDAAVQSYLSNLQLNTLMLGGTNIHTASSNQALAQAYCRN